MILIVDRKKSTITYSAGTLLIQQSGGQKRRVPVNQLEMLVIHGSAMVSTSVWQALAQAGVPALALPGRGLLVPAMLGSGLATQLPLRRLQHRCASAQGCNTGIVKWLVAEKLASYRVALKRLEHWDDTPAGRDARATFSRQLEQAANDLHQSSCTEQVHGQEGRAARAWFQLLAQRLPAQWKFSGRNRRPPTDPVNALLSLGYTLLLAEIRQAILTFGLDPSLGFLHKDYPGREGLALDLCEPYRSGVDALVIDLIFGGELTPRNFYYRDQEGCRLSKEARPVFYQAWADHRAAWPRYDKDTEGELRQHIGGLMQRMRKELSKALGEEAHG